MRRLRIEGGAVFRVAVEDILKEHIRPRMQYFIRGRCSFTFFRALKPPALMR